MVTLSLVNHPPSHHTYRHQRITTNQPVIVLFSMAYIHSVLSQVTASHHFSLVWLSWWNILQAWMIIFLWMLTLSIASGSFQSHWTLLILPTSNLVLPLTHTFQGERIFSFHGLPFPLYSYDDNTICIVCDETTFGTMPFFICYMFISHFPLYLLIIKSSYKVYPIATSTTSTSVIYYIFFSNSMLMTLCHNLFSFLQNSSGGHTPENIPVCPLMSDS